jgi:hypothetical protein
MDEPTTDAISLTESELSLLATVTEDGFPIRVLAATLSSEQVEELKADAMRLLSHGLVGVYASTEEVGEVPEETAHAVLVSSENWLGVSHGPAWFIATTPRGDRVLAGRGLGMRRRHRDQ